MLKQTATKNEFILEVFLIIITVALSVLLYTTVGYKMIVLNLFYLPVILAGFFLGQYRAGVLALLCVIAASIVSVSDIYGFAALNSPIITALAITVWAAVLGLTALLVGTLSDERSSKMVELHEAHVGVIEVLARYLQSANPRLKARSHRVAELCQRVAVQMRLSPKEVDDIRVAALLHDMENLEITARVIRKAMGDLENEQQKTNLDQHTFHGTELAHSLGTVLSGAFPLLLNQTDGIQTGLHDSRDGSRSSEMPFGARIIRTVRAYDALIDGELTRLFSSPEEAIEELRSDTQAEHHPAVLHALERVVAQDAAQRARVAEKTSDTVTVSIAE